MSSIVRRGLAGEERLNGRVEEDGGEEGAVVIAFKVEEFCKDLENKFREAKEMPQHRYLTRPIYKACVGYIGPVAATAVSFLAADVIVHHLIWQTAGCFDTYLRSGEASCALASCALVWNPVYTVSWMAVAVPVMYAKYRR